MNLTIFGRGVEIGFLASTWGLPPWPGLGRLLESSTWGLPPLIFNCEKEVVRREMAHVCSS